jgi:hypothetical protein
MEAAINAGQTASDGGQLGSDSCVLHVWQVFAFMPRANLQIGRESASRMPAIGQKQSFDTVAAKLNHSGYLGSSKGKIRCQSCFMLTTCHPPALAASSDALSFSAYANSRTSSSWLIRSWKFGNSFVWLYVS